MATWKDGSDRRHLEGRKWALWALEQWEPFPTLGQRPLVLTGPMVWSQAEHRTGMAKLAYLNRDWELPSSVPDAVLHLARASGGRTRPRSGEYEPLQIKRGTLDQASFETDRGPQVLPAWRLESDQALGPMWVLDPEIASTVWATPEPTPTPPTVPRPTQRLNYATPVRGDEASLAVFFTGGHPAWVNYPSADIFESDHAVVILPRAHDTGPPGFRALLGVQRELVAKLARPLGRRVLANPDATAVGVLMT
ncbi:MAG: hypothetical protein WBA31_02405 [Candidatus Dormiibacterota bacterium]